MITYICGSERGNKVRLVVHIVMMVVVVASVVAEAIAVLSLISLK